MYSEFINEKINIVVALKGDNLLEYTGILIKDSDDLIMLSNVNISYLMLNFQKSVFGGNINKYKENLSKVVINKRYIVSVD